MTTVELSTINLQAPTQLRLMKESQLHIEELAFAYADKGEFTELPWVGRIAGSDVLVPIDGFHRLHAIEWLGSDEFKKYEGAPDISHINTCVAKVRITDFPNIGMAIVSAAGVNGAHGMKRKVGDIATAIEAILKVERRMFMIGDYKLDKEHIMRIVNCSATSYTTETEKMRGNLTSQRNFDIRAMNDEGMSQRDIAEKVGCGQKTVSRLLGDEGESNERSVKMTQEENLELEGGGKRPMAKIPQEEEEEEDTTSVFTHFTSVEPVANPWGPKKEVEPAKVVNTPKHGQKEVMTNLELSKLVDSLSAVQRKFLKSCLA
jgi:transcriptional regulator with XRE-family HTH domain